MSVMTTVVVLIALAVCHSAVAQNRVRNPCDRITCGPGYCVPKNGRAVCICPSGYRFDPRITTCVPNDTPTCFPSCGIDECGLFPPNVTPYTCPNGFRLDNCGCVDPSDCLCEGCPDFNRNLQCPNGFETDSNGCPVSRCASPTPPPPPPPPPDCPTCFETECGLFWPTGSTPYSCPNGFRVDSCGCTDFNCQCAGCPDLDRSVNCPYGYKTRRGCPASVCIQRAGPQVRCPRQGEPIGELGNFCSTSNGCLPDKICCPSPAIATCIDGIPL